MVTYIRSKVLVVEEVRYNRGHGGRKEGRKQIICDGIALSAV